MGIEDALSGMSIDLANLVELYKEKNLNYNQDVLEDLIRISEYLSKASMIIEAEEKSECHECEVFNSKNCVDCLDKDDPDLNTQH